MTNRFSSPKTINLGLQDLAIRKKFPSFKIVNKIRPQWIGKLKPTEHSNYYKIKVQYDPYLPKVFVVKPEILWFAPHRYDDESLCLYHPNDKSFSPDMLISDTLIPWTCEWLYFYEVWLDEGVWWGKEAPHSPTVKEKGSSDH